MLVLVTMIEHSAGNTMDNIIRLRLDRKRPVYGVVHGVSGCYPCNAKINGGSWLQKIVVWSLRQTVTTGASIRDTAK